MKKLTLFMAALMISAMTMAEVAPRVTLNFKGPDNFNIGTTKIKVDSSFMYNGDTIRLIADANNGYNYYINSNSKPQDTVLFMGKSGAAIQFQKYDFPIGKIVFYGGVGASGNTKLNVFVGDTAVSTEVTGSKGTNTFIINSKYQVAGTQFFLKVTNAYNAQFQKIEIYEAVIGAPEVPVFSPKGGTYTSAQNVTLSCATDGATIQYSFDGETYLEYSEALQVESTQTIYAKAVKNKIESEVVAATYNIVSLEGDGSKENPYSIADLAILNNPGDSAWVGGYIIGCANTNGNLITDSTKLVDSNVLLADSADATKGLPVALSKADHKSAIGVATNRANVGKYLKVYGALVSYMGKCGVKNVSDYVLEGGATGIMTPKQENVPVKKMMINGQMMIVRDGKMFNALGAEL